ncbi:MAG: DNA-processing protein DprA [Mycobacteriales bacterium]
MSDGARLARVALSHVIEPGHPGLWDAVTRLGPEQVWALVRQGRPQQWLSGRLTEGARLRADGYDPQADLDRLEACGGRLLCPGDADWPSERLLWPTEDLAVAPPLVLYARGPGALAHAVERSVAVVGARAATAYGAHVAGELGLGLAARGCAVISGGAYGIDAAAHAGALNAQGAPTLAVLACGIDIAYPRGNDRLLERIAESGLVLSELPPGASPTRARFLVRNRLIAALSLGTVVVEAALRSGSLATAGRARDLDRHVMAVPGPITSAMSAGAHAELRRPGTVCVTSAAEVLDTIGRLGEDGVGSPRAPEQARDALDASVRAVLEAVPVGPPAGEATIARTAGVSVLLAQQALPALLVAGLVDRADGGWRLTALGLGRPAR